MNRNWTLLRAIIMLALWAGSGCQPESKQSPEMVPGSVSNSTESAGRRVFAVKGVVTEVIAERKKVRIAHEEIPDYMAAMTMLFDVQDINELAGLQSGDEVAFDMVVTEDDGWIEHVKKTGAVSEIVTDVPGIFRRVRDVDPVDEGDPMPDYQFTNEVGQVVRLADMKGQAYAFTFIFTRCPYPDFCPRMSKYMRAVYDGMSNLEDGPDNWRLFSITIDPEFDTPAVLKGYAQAYGYDPKRWNYLTAPLIDITAVSEQVGLQFYRPEPGNPAGLNHNLRTVVVDATGIIRRILPGNEWDAGEIVAALREGAEVKDGE